MDYNLKMKETWVPMVEFVTSTWDLRVPPKSRAVSRSLLPTLQGILMLNQNVPMRQCVVFGGTPKNHYIQYQNVYVKNTIYIHIYMRINQWNQIYLSLIPSFCIPIVDHGGKPSSIQGNWQSHPTFRGAGCHRSECYCRGAAGISETKWI